MGEGWLELLGRARAAVITSEAGYISPYNTSVPLQNKKENISSWKDWSRETSLEIQRADGNYCPKIGLRILTREESREIKLLTISG